MVFNPAAPQSSEPTKVGLEWWDIPIQGMSCGSCTVRVQSALKKLPGVVRVRVELGSGLATIAVQPDLFTSTSLPQAVEAVGYSTGAITPHIEPASIEDKRDWKAKPSPSIALPVISGLLGTLALMAVYATLVSLAQGFDHLLQLMGEDWYLIAPIMLAFGVQVGLFMRLRQMSHRGNRAATASVGVSGGSSTVAMVACCAHHAADILPVLGLSGAALFLADYRQQLMLFGIASSLVGIVIMVRKVRSL